MRILVTILGVVAIAVALIVTTGAVALVWIGYNADQPALTLAAGVTGAVAIAAAGAAARTLDR